MNDIVGARSAHDQLAGTVLVDNFGQAIAVAPGIFGDVAADDFDVACAVASAVESIEATAARPQPAGFLPHRISNHLLGIHALSA